MVSVIYDGLYDLWMVSMIYDGLSYRLSSSWLQPMGNHFGRLEEEWHLFCFLASSVQSHFGFVLLFVLAKAFLKTACSMQKNSFLQFLATLTPIFFWVKAAVLLLVLTIEYGTILVFTLTESESVKYLSHWTVWDPMDCSPSGSSVHGIIQARILEWVAIPFSRGLNLLHLCKYSFSKLTLNWWRQSFS